MAILSSTIALLALAGSNAAAAMASTTSSSAAAAAKTGATFESGFDIRSTWANLAPYADSDGYGAPKGSPRQCELSQVHLLARHGERYPTYNEIDGGIIENFASKLANFSAKHPKAAIGTGPLVFLNYWDYLLELDSLLPMGASTSASSGAELWSRYGRLLYRADRTQRKWENSMNVYPNGTTRPKPIFRTTNYPRVFESAVWFLGGFFSNTDANNSEGDYDLVSIPEVAGFNNTLASYEACTEGETAEETALLTFIATFTKAPLKRLAKYFPSGFNLQAVDVYAMMNLCPYESALLGDSSFCSLFTEDEWRSFEYALDLEFYGVYGWGSPSGRAQGIGYVQELAARLEGRVIPVSRSSINSTWDDNTQTFPLNQPLYMDMSHDNTIVSVLTALSLKYFNYGPNGLPGNVATPPARTFNLAELVPCGSWLASEIWTCPSDVSFENLQEQLYKNPDLSSTANTTDYIRFVLNSAPVSLEGLGACNGSVNAFCPVENFLGAVPALTEEAMYAEACFGSYNITSQVANGNPITS
ncbi:hypothetical protein N7504_009864 [Penicillium tannophilum]|nr:hypothetical protein N7504_009864 [Penicillium tannophilum]